MRDFLEIVNYVFIFYFVLLNGSYLLMSLIAIRTLVRYARRKRLLHLQEQTASGTAPPIAIIAPMYNEEAVCAVSVRSLLGLRYPTYGVILVNDGSTDNTLEHLIRAFEFVPVDIMPTASIPTADIKTVYRSVDQKRLWLIDKENGGKADALNAGINYCRAPLFCAIDADTLLESDGLMRVVQPFLEDSDVIASGGIVRIVNNCTVASGQVVDVRLPTNELARLQVTEYLRAFLSGRVAWDVLQMVVIISGAFGLFRRSVVIDAGGFSTDTIGEDMELVVRLHRHCREKRIPYKIRYIPDPVAWTEAPESMRVLGRQRDRWQRGLAQVLVANIGMVLNPRYGRIGMLALPYFVVFELLGPILEIFGYGLFVFSMLIGAISAPVAIAFFMVAFVLGVALSLAAVTLEELSFRRYSSYRDLFGLFRLAITENFGYRQLNTFWRVKGLWSFARGKTGWGEMTRKGFATSQ